MKNIAPKKIEKLSSKILKCTNIYGTDASFLKYYDIYNSVVSSEFHNVSYDDKEKVAYIDFRNDKTYLEVQKIFSNNIMFTEELDLGGAKIATASQFDVNIIGDTVTVKYPYGPNYKEVTKTFSLKN